MSDIKVLGNSFTDLNALGIFCTDNIHFEVQKNGAVKATQGTFSTTRNALVRNAIQLANQDKTTSLKEKAEILEKLKTKLSEQPSGGRIAKWRQNLGNLFYNRTKKLDKTIKSLETERAHRIERYQSLWTAEATKWLKQKNCQQKSDVTETTIRELALHTKSIVNNKKLANTAHGLTDDEQKEALYVGCKEALIALPRGKMIKGRALKEMYTRLDQSLRSHHE